MTIKVSVEADSNYELISFFDMLARQVKVIDDEPEEPMPLWNESEFTINIDLDMTGDSE